LRVGRVVHQQLAHQRQGDGAGDAPDQALPAPDYHHGEEQEHVRDAERLRCHVPDQPGVEDSGESTVDTRQQERGHPQHRHLDPDRAGGERVVAHGPHPPAQRGVHDEEAEREGDGEQDQFEVVEQVLAGQVDAEHRRDGDRGDALGATGDLGVGDPVGEREGQAQRDDAEVVRLHPQGGGTYEEADHRGGDHRDGGRGPEAEAGLGGEDGGQVGADTEERDLGQVDLTGNAHCQAQTDGQQGEQDHHVDHVDRVRVEPVRQ
jgi:hypothetical protein